MRTICIVGPSKKFLSGLSYYTIRLANALAMSNDVSVVCLRKLLPQFLFPGKEHVGKKLSDLEFSSKISVYDGMDYNSPLSWIRAFNFIKKKNPDVIILQWWTSSVVHMHLFLKIFNALFIKSKLIIEFHEVVDPLEESILPIRLYSRIFCRLLAHKVDAYVVHSSFDKEQIASKYRLDEGEMYIIPHGLYNHYKPIDKEKAKSALKIKEKFVILHFGLIRKYKGIPYLIDAFERMPEDVAEQSRLLIIGELWEGGEEVVQRVETSKLRDKIILIPKYVSDDDIPLYFSAADVIVFPYLRASQSGAAHIAMCFKKPIITSAVGGLNESMSKYGGASFVPPGDANAIAKALIGCYERPKEIKCDLAEFSWDTTTSKYFDVIDRIRNK
ncbi:MAG: glycosyltransferase [Methanocellales archaeon]|nr:glycosyltransferase [Methanocellales archaeon]MDD3291849.1 glycosyltransferase [Methanocellales archaeon]MDD5235492.1 glycosyltransferase [Methanocellales archaeon]MDD5485111.1 glycosyltransferase [Methanocellales archaeon]